MGTCPFASNNTRFFSVHPKSPTHLKLKHPPAAASNRREGTVIRWNDERGFGFVRDSVTSDQIFLHISEISQKWLRPKVGDQISYLIALDGGGKKRARSVSITSIGFTETNKGQAIIFLIMFFVAVSLGAYIKWVPQIILQLYLLMSGITMAFYRLDKWFAQSKQWRVPESSLHWLSFFFGWPGAHLAQQSFRHKSAKKRFRYFFYLTIFLNLILAGYIISPQGDWLEQLIVDVFIELFKALQFLTHLLQTQLEQGAK
jgi:uncharacterized membrane protein YsdA (DUF1294 family)/cold shock CspA family protein